MREYKILSGNSVEDLELKVNTLLNEGYTINGGLSITATDADIIGNNHGFYWGIRPTKYIFSQALSRTKGI